MELNREMYRMKEQMDQSEIRIKNDQSGIGMNKVAKVAQHAKKKVNKEGLGKILGNILNLPGI